MSTEPSVPIQRPALLREGVSEALIRSHLRSNRWTRIRSGVYLPSDSLAGMDDDQRLRIQVESTAVRIGDGAVVSHQSAAVLHGLPLWGVAPGPVHVIRDRAAGGHRRSTVHTHTSELPAEQTRLIGQLVVASVARTVIDCACLLGFESAVCVADAALHRKLTTPTELAAVLAMLGQPKGVRQAREVLAFADSRSESVGESRSRVRLWRCGLTPELQFVVRSGRTFIGRCDFGFEDQRTLGEFDGKIKYWRLLKPGQNPGDVVWLEKQREDALRRAGWEVVRWTWAELDRPELIAARIRAAFELAR
jgi:hypothetical protein